MEADALDYDLPAAAIAQEPLEPRDAARLLDATGGALVDPVDRTVRDLPGLLGPGDLLVLNDTRVRKARLRLRKATGGSVEVLFLHPIEDEADRWEALVGAAHRVAEGTELAARGATVVVEEDRGDGVRGVRLERHGSGGGHDVFDDNGEVPLPPYIHRAPADPERYQTVYAQPPDRARSAAAPTAGLHLTAAVLDACVAAGVRIARLELEVGLGTFRPVSADRVEDHPMHAERFDVPAETLTACLAADRVVAVGTTVVRALESAARAATDRGSTDLFILPGFRFQVVDRLLTNFHAPRSTLLALLEAFAGPGWRSAYAAALDRGYRFLSFGDAMLVDRAA